MAYVELPGLVEHVAALPITVNVVPGDEAAGRVPHPTVHSEILFQEAQDVKRQASEAFERGEFENGQRLMGETKARLAASLEAASEMLKAEIRAEIDEVEQMDQMSMDMGVAVRSDDVEDESRVIPSRQSQARPQHPVRKRRRGVMAADQFC